MIESIDDSKSRQFICACGKNYLSYAALFTHIKQKHEGKAPGPIIRPRSERKRGRPRKSQSQPGEFSKENKEEDNSFSDELENGILKEEDIHNIKEKEEENKGGIFLGRGSFAAFTAYKPELSKSEKSREKKIMRKVSKSSMKESNLQDIKEGGEVFSFEGEESKIEEAFAFYDKLNTLNRSELKKLFCNQDLMSKTLSFLFEESKVFKQINQKDYDNAQKTLDLTIKEGILLFLEELKVVFMCENTAKTPHSENDQEMPLEENMLKLNQTIAMTVFFLEDFQHENKVTTEELLNLSITKLVSYLSQFIQCDLPRNISKHQLQTYDLFKGSNPLSFILFFNNWLTISKAELELAQIIKKRELSPEKDIDERQNEENQMEEFHSSSEKIENEENGSSMKEDQNPNEILGKIDHDEGKIESE